MEQEGEKSEIDIAHNDLVERMNQSYTERSETVSQDKLNDKTLD
jgi:hypothetical protein